MPIPAKARLVEFPAWGANRPSPRLSPVSEATDEAAERAQAAYERGLEEGLAAGRDEFQRKLEETRIAFEQRLVEERAAWATEEGERLSDKIDAALATLEARISDAVAGILSPFVEESARTRSLDALVEVLAPLLAKGEHANFKVRGPKDLLDALRAKLGAGASVFSFEIGDGVDVKVLADRTLIETQLEFWRTRIGRSA